MNWHLQDAKNNFSKVVQRARSEGPQTVTLRGERAAVVLSAEDYDRLAGKKKTLAEYLLTGPVWDDDFAEEVNRRSDTMIRDIDL
ncbi:type II toxin-antitoxin system Phd/YefM family antitoxin [Mesorhizobium mediterraneum]|uniref:Antitoxin n=1 Tax=Mesorhizobium mediterraneum TaxID=43617 RepID=A0AB36R4M0_9HYPH|nr:MULTISPECIES: type II toxin-antitoxin system Phd/YefM family antitoxin [Mesorhizobium]RUU10494.1 type II toxin-antitoxin system Phd/YefM family antitoxin [Mesorhizobium sp. M6A.T.Ca.TU.002.02.2.1]PAP99695.1 prevent-host-death protein [Mesorhizobium mediterraneum]RUU33536.1 type II toxin-antitoxin system Phd/YefM family antitoxin [Mesorhizobium sp. M6A.T.Ce.TU.002.03.1.1]RUV02519.1 type II toxin-antitoxin system Phd/YefM family antitoxin [Mesorhizobium sp. M6A.T.Cr.TU.017.01.1.1]RVB79498.1 t